MAALQGGFEPLPACSLTCGDRLAQPSFPERGPTCFATGEHSANSLARQNSDSSSFGSGAHEVDTGRTWRTAGLGLPLLSPEAHAVPSAPADFPVLYDRTNLTRSGAYPANLEQKEDHKALQAQLQLLSAHLSMQQAEQTQLQQSLALLQQAASSGGASLACADPQWLALHLQQARSYAASYPPLADGMWAPAAPRMQQRHGAPNDGLTHKERRRRRRAQEREAAAQLAIAAGCAHCLPEGSMAPAAQLNLPMGIDPNMMLPAASMHLPTATSHLPMATSLGINPAANAIPGMNVPMTSIFGPNLPALATLGLDALHLA